MNTQWHVGKPGFVFIYGPNGEEIAQVSPFQFTREDAQALAAQIVREHNAHDELVAALQAWREWHADHFEDFDSDVNAQLLCLANDTEAALAKAGAA